LLACSLDELEHFSKSFGNYKTNKMSIWIDRVRVLMYRKATARGSQESMKQMMLLPFLDAATFEHSRYQGIMDSYPVKISSI
jgi:hypothetical protein